jgi:hypothetical protein
MTDIVEDFDLDAEITLLEQQGASAQKYFMHSNAHQMAFAKYATSAKGAKEMGNAALAKKLNAMGKKHKAAAEALGALAGHHVDHEFSRQLRIKQAMKENINELSKDKIEAYRQKAHDDSKQRPGGRRLATDKLTGRAKVLAKEDVGVEELVENFVKMHKKGDGYEGRRTKAQEAMGKHVARVLGNTTQVQHHEKGGLNIFSKGHGKPGNNKHVREMSNTLTNHGIPHRYEEGSRQRHTDRLYVASSDAHDHGLQHLHAKASAKIHNDHAKDRERLVQHNEEVELVDTDNELNELSKMKLQKYSRLASKDAKKDRSKGVALAQDKLKEEEEIEAASAEFIDMEGFEIDTIDEDVEDEIEVNPIQELISLAIERKPTDFTAMVQDIIRSVAADRLEQLQEQIAREAGGTAEELEEISVPPTGKPVLTDHGKTISDPSTKNPPTLTQGKNGAVKGNAKTPEQKSVSKEAGDTFRSKEAAD